jgi:hypothetical protein
MGSSARSTVVFFRNCNDRRALRHLLVDGGLQMQVDGVKTLVIGTTSPSLALVRVVAENRGSRPAAGASLLFARL